MARNRVTPTNATASGFHLRTLRRSVRSPATYSDGLSVSIPGVGRGIRFVIPKPHSGSRPSSSARIGSSTSFALSADPSLYPPEATYIRDVEPGEVVSDGGGPDAGVDADKQDAHRRTDPILERR